MKDNCDKELVRVVNHCIADTLKRQDIVFDVEILLQRKRLLMCLKPRPFMKTGCPA